MQQKQMKRKGMTLLEVIISIAVYAVLALLLAEIMTLVNSTMRSTEQLNKRLSYEAKYADNLNIVDADGTQFDKLTEAVGGVDVPAVKVSIRYDVKETDKVKSAAGQVVSIAADANKTIARDLSNNELRASEYTTRYDETSTGTHYHDNTNYRFMTFDKVSLGKSVKPGGAFPVHIHFLKGTNYSDFDMVVVRGNLVGKTFEALTSADASYPFQYVDDANDDADYIVNVVNDATEDPEEIKDDTKANKGGKLMLYLYKKTAYGATAGKDLKLVYDKTSFGDGTDPTKFDYSDENQITWALTVDYLLSVKGGTTSNPVMNYYNRYDVVFDGTSLRVPTDAEKQAWGCENTINY